jgi:prephenate dehydrogenase
LKFKKIALFGLGLLGGSICRDLRKISDNVELLAFGRDVDKLAIARNDGLVDYIGSIKEPDLQGVDLAIVALPVIISIDFITNILNNSELDQKALVIDVGSVKGAILNIILKNKRAGRFIGCHPMAGSEKDGFQNSREGLFENASVILTPNEFNYNEDIELIREFWHSLGARTIVLPADLHDLIVSRTSHLPHMVACLIVDIYNELTNDTSLKKHISADEFKYFIGKGFIDVTRISSGLSHIWTDISIMNSSNISKSIDKLIKKLEFLKGILDSENINPEELRSFFNRIREYKLAIDCE